MSSRFVDLLIVFNLSPTGFGNLPSAIRWVSRHRKMFAPASDMTLVCRLPAPAGASHSLCGPPVVSYAARGRKTPAT